MALTNKELKLIAEIVSETVNKTMSENRRRDSSYSEDIISELKHLSRETRNYINKTQSNIDLKDLFTEFTENLKKRLEESNKKIDERQEDFLKLQEDYFKQQKQVEEDRKYIEGLKKDSSSDPTVIKELEQIIDQNQKALEKFLEKYDKKVDILNEQIQKNIEENQKQLTEEMFTGLKRAGEGIFRKDLRETKNVDEATENYKKALLKQYAALEENSETMLELGITSEKLDEIKQDLYSSYIEELERQRDKANLDSKTKKILEEKIKKEKIELGRSTYEETYGKTSAIGKLSGRLADFTTKRFKEENEKTSIAAKAFNSGLGALFKGKGAKQPYLETGKKTAAGILISDIEKENQKKNFKKSESFVNNNVPVPPRLASPKPVVPQPTIPEPTPSQTSEPKVPATLSTPQSTVPLPTPNIIPQKIEETKKIEESLAEKNAKIEATTSVNPTADSENINYLLQLVEEAKENAPFKVIISDIGAEGKKNLTDVFNDAINETLKPIITEDLAEILKENNKLTSLLKLKRKSGKEEPKKESKNEQGSGVPPSIYKRGAKKALEYGAKGYGYMTGGLGIKGLLGSSAGAALTGKLGAGAFMTAGGLVVGTAAAGGALGYGLEQYGGKDEDTGNRKGGVGTFLIERSIGQSKERKNEQIIKESQENQKYLNLRTDLSPTDKKIERFKLDIERLQKQKEINNSIGYSLSEKQDNASIDKLIDKLKDNISKLENQKKEASNKKKETVENIKTQIEESSKIDPFLESGAFTAALEGTPEPYDLSVAEKKPEDTEKLQPPVIATKQDVEDGRFSKKEQTISDKKDFIDYYKTPIALTGDEVPTDEESIKKLQAELYKQKTQGHPYSEENPEFKEDPKLWEALKKNKPGYVYKHDITASNRSAQLMLTPHPLHTSDAARMGTGMQQSAMESVNYNKIQNLSRSAMNSYVKASSSGIFGKNMTAVVEALKEQDVNKAKKLVQEDLKQNPGLANYLPQELLDGSNSNILSKKAETDINKALSEIENTQVPGIGGTDVSSIRELVSKGDYKTAVKAMEYISKVQGRESVPLDPDTYKNLTGKEIINKKATPSTIVPEKADTSKKVTSSVSKETSNVMPQIKLEPSNITSELEPLLVANNFQTQQTNEILQQLLKVMAGKDYNPTSITPVMVNPIASNSTSTQTQSPAYEFRTQNRVMA